MLYVVIVTVREKEFFFIKKLSSEEICYKVFRMSAHHIQKVTKYSM